MVFLAGTFTALELYPFQLQVVARFLPLTYAVEALRNSIVYASVTYTYAIDIGAMALFTVIFLVLATAILRKRIS
jgi:ABC-2 type transport system permease protein